MLKHIRPTSQIFIGLLVITLLLTYLAISLSDYTIAVINSSMAHQSKMGQMQKRMSQNYVQSNLQAKVDTTDWLTYTDKTMPISFKYPKTWTVKTSTTAQKFYDIALTVPKEKTAIHFYVSKDGYLGLDGLKQTPYSLNGVKGVIVSDNLIGVKKGEYYYTFDGSLNLNQTAEFTGILNSIKFQ